MWSINGLLLWWPLGTLNTCTGGQSRAGSAPGDARLTHTAIITGPRARAHLRKQLLHDFVVRRRVELGIKVKHVARTMQAVPCHPQLTRRVHCALQQSWVAQTVRLAAQLVQTTGDSHESVHQDRAIVRSSVGRSRKHRAKRTVQNVELDRRPVGTSREPHVKVFLLAGLCIEPR